MAEEKTLITHAVTGKARFLNYEIGILRDDEGRTPMEIGNMRTSRRSLNGGIRLSIPKDVTQKWKAHVVKENKVQQRTELMNLSEYDIISLYETQLQGLINYYTLAQNVSKEMYRLRYDYKRSLIKILTLKLKTSCRDIMRKFTVYTGDGKKVIGVIIPREGKQLLKAVFGKKPIHTQKRTIIVDKISKVNTERTELIRRLLAESCELCGKVGEKVYGHHVRKLKDLKKSRRGKKDIPAWGK